MQSSSHYKLKGTFLINLKKFISNSLGEAYFHEIANKVGITNSKIILASSWYEAEKCIMMQQAAAQKQGIPFKDFVHKSVQFMLESDLNGVYKFFLRTGGPKFVLAKIPQMSKAYSNFTEIEVLKNEDGLCQLKYKTPESLRDWQYTTDLGGFSGILNVCKRPMKKMEALEESTIEENGEKYSIVIYQIDY